MIQTHVTVTDEGENESNGARWRKRLQEPEAVGSRFSYFSSIAVVQQVPLRPITGISSQSTSVHGIWYQSYQGKGTRHRMEPHFHVEKRQNQGQERGQLSMVTGPSLLVLLQKDSIPSSQGKDVVVVLDGCLVMHTPEQNNGAHVESQTGKDIPTQGGKSSTGCEDPTSLSKQVFRPKATSHVT